MKFQFKLRNGKKGSSIISELRIGTEIRLRLTTPFVIPVHSVKYWDKKTQLLKIPNDILNSDLINKRLNEIRTQVYYEFSKTVDSGIFDKEFLNNRLKYIVNPVKEKNEAENERSISINVVDYYQKYIEFYKENMSPNTGRVLSKGTIRTYKNALRFLKDYLRSKGVENFKFEEINKEFYYDLIQYGQDSGYTKNYIGSVVQKFKTIIQAAYDENIHSNGEFKKRYFRKFREDVNHPYLTDEEIAALYNLKINNAHLDNIRDIFIIACYTGLRIGDLLRFLKKPRIEIFNGREHIYIIQHKTRKAVFIPLKQIILKILERRNGNFPEYIHENLINKEIKPLLKTCGITQPYTVEKTIGGKSHIITRPKYELISCHSARRSFCTNAYNSGVPLQDIMAFSGHSSEKMVLLYIKASAKEKAKRASDHVFFK